jgi:hypothetical protein
MNKYKIVNPNEYKTGNIIMTRDVSGKTVIGIIEEINNNSNKITLLRLDKEGRIIIDASNDKLLLTMNNMNTLRDTFRMYVGVPSNDDIQKAYDQYKLQLGKK